MSVRNEWRIKFCTFYDNNSALHFFFTSFPFHCYFSFGWYESKVKLKCIFFLSIKSFMHFSAPFFAWHIFHEFSTKSSSFFFMQMLTCLYRQNWFSKLATTYDNTKNKHSESRSPIICIRKRQKQSFYHLFTQNNGELLVPYLFSVISSIRMNFVLFCFLIKKSLLSYLNRLINYYWMVEIRVFKDGRQM